MVVSTRPIQFIGVSFSSTKALYERHGGSLTVVSNTVTLPLTLAPMFVLPPHPFGASPSYS